MVDDTRYRLDLGTPKTRVAREAHISRQTLYQVSCVNCTRSCVKLGRFFKRYAT
ncbi:MAG: hypothetical protein ACRCYZ_02310 [Alphaproteobacteria bacterium]